MLRYIFLKLILPGVLNASQIYGVISDINLGKFPAVIINWFKYLLSLFLLWYSHYILHFVFAPQSSDIPFCFLSLFFFLSSFLGFCWYILYLRDLFLSRIQSADKPIRSTLYFSYSVCISSIFCSFLAFLSPYLTSLIYSVCCAL